MEVEKIAINIEDVELLKSELHHDHLKDIHTRYIESLHQILELLASPLTLMALSMAEVKKDHLSIRAAARLSMLVNHPPSDPKQMAEDLVDFFNENSKNSTENIVDHAQSKLREFYESSEAIKTFFNTLALTAVVNSWTLFESFSKEIWQSSLNQYPNLLNKRIIEAKGDGVGKSIPLNILPKYNYNVANHLGDILFYKYDFTSVEGIGKAYEDLFNLKKEDLTFLQDQNVNQLEISRHVIVHNGGVIDSKYLARAKRNEELINHKLTLTVDDTSNMINSSVRCLKSLIVIANEKI